MEACKSTNPRGDCDSSSFTGDDDLRAQEVQWRVQKFLRQRVMVNFFYPWGVAGKDVLLFEGGNDTVCSSMGGE